MKLFTLFWPLLALQNVATHSVFTTLFVNDVDQGDGTCVRMNMNPDNCTSPVIDLASNDMACGTYLVCFAFNVITIWNFISIHAAA
jgi:hypothetical protein